MKKTAILLLAFVIATAAFAQNGKGSKGAKTDPKKQNTSSGYVMPDFRDIKWGTHIDSVYTTDGVKINFVKSTEMGDKNAYYIADDDMTIGTVVLKNIYYIFNKDGRFISAVLNGFSKQLGEIKFILTNKFGQPENAIETPATKQFYWNVDDVRVTLTNENLTEVFTVEFYSDYEISESKRVNRNVDDF